MYPFSFQYDDEDERQARDAGAPPFDLDDNAGADPGADAPTPQAAVPTTQYDAFPELDANQKLHLSHWMDEQNADAARNGELDDPRNIDSVATGSGVRVSPLTMDGESMWRGYNNTATAMGQSPLAFDDWRKASRAAVRESRPDLFAETQSQPDDDSAPPASWQNPGPSPMWEAYSKQQMHTLPDSDPQSTMLTLADARSAPASDSGDTGRTAGLGIAAFLDLALNRGRNTGTLLGTMVQGSDPYKQQMRDLELQKTQAEINHLNRAGIGDPSMMAWRMANLDARNRALELQSQGVNIRERGQATREEDLARKRDEWNAWNDPDSGLAQNARDIAVKYGGQAAESLVGLNAKQIAERNPVVNDYLRSTGTVGEARTQQAARTAAAEETAKISPEVAKETALLAPRAATAGAVAEAGARARLPSEKEMKDYEKTLAASGPPIDENTQKLIDQWEEEHPGMYVAEAETFARNRLNAGRGEVKARGDEQQSSRLTRAMATMKAIVAESDQAGADLKRQYELRRKYNIAESKATGALSELSHNNTESGRTLDASKIPSFMNPDRTQMLTDADEVYQDAAQGIMATYGVRMGYRPSGTARAQAKPRAKPRAPQRPGTAAAQPADEDALRKDLGL